MNHAAIQQTIDEMRSAAAIARSLGLKKHEMIAADPKLLDDWAEALTAALQEVAPLPLNPAQERAVQEWAADDRLWTTQETVAFNLRTFAREIQARAVPVS